MINQPHEATSCSFNKLDKIVQEIERYHLSAENGQLIPRHIVLGNPVWILVAGNECKAKPFGYPIKANFRGTDVYVVDTRSQTSATSFGQYRITNHPDYELSAQLGFLTSIWDSPDRRIVANIASDLSPIYATWLSSTISAAFNLAVDQRTEISIIAAFFYWNQLDVEDSIDKIASRISIDLKLEFDRVIEVIENSGDVSNLEGFLNALKASSAGVRLKHLDVSALYQVCTGVWTGALGRTVMEIAIEYPPYIVGLVSNVLTDKSYRRTRFNDYVKIFDRRREIQELPHALTHIFKSA